MMMLGNSNLLSADKPIADPKDDRLGYAPFAKHLADSVANMAPPEGLVIAIYGPWGSGKTTALKFVMHYLKQKPEDEQPIIVEFNPWWFSGHEDLTRRFFDQLQVALSKWKSLRKVKDVVKRIGTFAAGVALETPLPYISTGGKVVAQSLTPKQKDVPELKEKVAEALRKQNKRILVIIDDIDRLTAEEIRQLFRVIKAVADFPNVVYLLAFDKEIAIRALAEAQGIPGEAYLEKIVQVPFELPLPDKTLLRGLLFERLNIILADTPEEDVDQTYWGNVYLEGIDHFITTPRDIVRLTNTLSVTYPAVKDEANPVDFIAVEALRVFCPLAYGIIRNNPTMFAGHVDSSGFLGPRPESLKSFHNAWISQIQQKDQEPVKRLLLRIFPKLGCVWGNVTYGSDWESTWRRQRRVCSPDILSVYFRLVIPAGDISNAEMKAFLAQARTAKAFGEKLVEHANQKRPDGTTRVRTLLERLEDYTESEIPSDAISSVVQALFDVGDQLWRPEDERSGMFEFGNEVRIGRIIWQLLRRLDESKRFEVLREAILNGEAVATITREVAIFDQQHGRYGAKPPAPGEEVLVTSEHLDELENIALQKIRDAVRRESLLTVPNLPGILYRWGEWAGKEESTQWVQQVIEDDAGLVTFLEKFLQKTYSQYMSDVVGRTNHRLDPRWLEPFLDPSQIVDRVRKLTENSGLTENEKTAILQFIQEYEMRLQGKNPDDPLP